MLNPNYFGIIKSSVYCIFIFLNIILFFFWLIYIIRNARKTWRELKKYKNSIHIDYQVRVKILFNYRTVLIKDAFLVCIAVIEIILPFYLGVPTFILNVYERSHKQYIHSIERQNKCNLKLVLDLILIDPAIQLIPISYGVLSISSMMFLTILTTYLARRYFGYSLEKRLLSHLIIWWVTQILFLFTTLIPYLQLLFITLPILQAIDWILLLKSSRKLSRTIKSKLFEVLHFENDFLRYRIQRVKYKTYNVFITIHLLSVLSTIILLCLWMITVPVKGLIINQCYLNHTYNIDIGITLDSNTREDLNELTTRLINKYATFVIELVYGLLLVVPHLCISLGYWFHFMCRGSRRAYRFNYAMIQPLLEQKLT